MTIIDRVAEKIIKETNRKDYQHVVYDVVDYLYLNNYLTDGQVKLADEEKSKTAISGQNELVVIQPLFRIGQKVLIDPINVTGRVFAYYYLNQIEYRVRYFDNGDVKEIYFYANELRAV